MDPQRAEPGSDPQGSFKQWPDVEEVEALLPASLIISVCLSPVSGRISAHA